MLIDLWKKGFVLGIILLFVGASISPVVTAFDNDTDADYELMDKPKKNGKSDDYKEIITWIRSVYEWDWIEKRGILRGTIQFYAHGWMPGIILFGLRLSNRGLELYWEGDLRGDFYVPHFIGFEINDEVIGIAVGNIERS